MTDERQPEEPFAPGTLARLVAERTEHALRAGALRPIPTRFEIVEQRGVGFLVRVVENLARKDRERGAVLAGKAPAARNPFLPYDPELHVCDATATHVCLLNKYNVVPQHLLIVTRAFEHQDRLLTAADFAALWRCMGEYEGLGFYNGGTVAGASQPHKHLQLVPLPLAPDGPPLPISPWLDAARFADDDPRTVGHAPRLPIAHALVRVDDLDGAEDPGPELAARYRALIAGVDLPTVDAGDGERHGRPYNLLVTRRQMLLAPRAREHFHGISINALGVAGALLVCDAEGLGELKRAGPVAVLRHVGAPPPTS